MDIPLFMSPFLGESYCLYPFWNSSRSKKLSFLFKKNCLFEFCRSDGGQNLAISFLDKINPFSFFLCIFVFCGECGCICMISICVADNQL